MGFAFRVMLCGLLRTRERLTLHVALCRQPDFGPSYSCAGSRVEVGSADWTMRKLGHGKSRRGEVRQGKVRRGVASSEFEVRRKK